jgi:hypothetical protein
LHKIVDEADKNNGEIKKLCETLKSELANRFDSVLEDDIFLIAAFIHPATTTSLTDDECDKARDILVNMVNFKILI